MTEKEKTNLESAGFRETTVEELFGLTEEESRRVEKRLAQHLKDSPSFPAPEFSFNIDEFIRESNAIDPQFDERGNLVPGSKPGEKMYDNMLAAWNSAMLLSEEEQFPFSVCLDIHRELTRGITVLENRGASGIYRVCEVTVSEQSTPSALVVRSMVEEHFIPQLNAFLTINFDQQSDEWYFGDKARNTVAWWAHDFFECIHPFLDGNGRTGRLILNMVRVRLGLEPIVVYFNDRIKYYDHIQHFCDVNFKHWMGSAEN